ncbi:MAG: Transcriptional regulatory protein ZraR [Acidobacteria bacterium ADurb.Bin051]|nr:MAG: Transcriptional regulatory protein ZraR [Acidobacteria bacterium ADurb.Bin051]
MRELILVTDDDPAQRSLLREVLEGEGYRVELAADGPACLAVLERERPAAVCLDQRMPGPSGLEILPRIHERYRDLPVILLTGVSDVDMVVQAMQLGAFDYLAKPVELARLLTVIRHAVERSRMAERLAELEAGPAVAGQPNLVGRSPAMLEVLRQSARVAATDITVLVIGESGTGKELAARAIHAASARAAGPLVTVNCAAIPESLQESALFGHERGSFTGAVAQRKGHFELADGGTLFLDEVAELSPSAQAKLLRVLQDRSFTRVGGTSELRSDFRLVAATHRDLASLVAEKRFREDLYFRVAVFEIHLPPLRERGDDVLLLASRFLGELGQAAGRTGLRLAPESADLLRAYSWPGNVRELENALQRAVVVSEGEVITPADLPERIRTAGARRANGLAENGAAAPPPLTLAEIEHRAIRAAVERHGGNLTEAADELGIGRSTLYRKLREQQAGASARAVARELLAERR